MLKCLVCRRVGARQPTALVLAAETQSKQSRLDLAAEWIVLASPSRRWRRLRGRRRRRRRRREAVDRPAPARRRRRRRRPARSRQPARWTRRARRRRRTGPALQGPASACRDGRQCRDDDESVAEILLDVQPDYVQRTFTTVSWRVNRDGQYNRNKAR